MDVTAGVRETNAAAETDALHSPSFTEPPNSEPLSKASFHVKVKQSCGEQRHALCVLFVWPGSLTVICVIRLIGYYLVFSEGELGLDRTQLVIISEEGSKQQVFA